VVAKPASGCRLIRTVSERCESDFQYGLAIISGMPTIRDEVHKKENNSQNCLHPNGIYGYDNRQKG
jgi:hypothetical protein